ncbi:tryptophan halogenase [Brevundimonas intermedia]|uniref:Tryptophan halogenase n=1 Tax=Brevundimonas intermedia TaxID=74315 RepID=A0ABQ5TCB0_9CAUL|nr:tryptophan halogenase family protein [Brevundimonas intermedia]GLK50003.1 tryptophan halogenase [Brevundimonas intermedia]
MRNTAQGQPKTVVILGGGTAGWMTATALTAVFNPEQVRVRLVESDDIGIVGVGEATLPAIREFNAFAGIAERDMLAATQGTYKLGIEFVDWGRIGSRYVHPFGAHGRPLGGAAFHHQWNRARLAGAPVGPIDDYAYAIEACRQNRFEPPSLDTSRVESTYSYAYHFDAGLYAGFLRRVAEGRGLLRTEGRVEAVERTGDHITALRLASCERIEGDLFIDCSGFRAIAIGEQPGDAWEDWSHWLPCDRAVAVPTARSEAFTPFTRSTASSAGWLWRIPLQHRTGNGHVYSSAHISDDEAAAALLAGVDGDVLAEPRFLRFRSGRRRASWLGNCVAVGLSSGFLEPLESTSIYLIQAAVTNLVKFWPGAANGHAVLRDAFNSTIDLEYDRVRDFLILHYWLNDRPEPFWRERRETEPPASLRETAALFQSRGHAPSYRNGLFAAPSWISVMTGQGAPPQGYDRLADHMPLAQVISALQDERARLVARVAAMPFHADYVMRNALGRAA